jgi:hypothetical protein
LAALEPSSERPSVPSVAYFDRARVNALFSQCTATLEAKGGVLACDIARLHAELVKEQSSMPLNSQQVCR